MPNKKPSKKPVVPATAKAATTKNKTVKKPASTEKAMKKAVTKSTNKKNSAENSPKNEKNAGGSKKAASKSKTQKPTAAKASASKRHAENVRAVQTLLNDVGDADSDSDSEAGVPEQTLTEQLDNLQKTKNFLWQEEHGHSCGAGFGEDSAKMEISLDICKLGGGAKTVSEMNKFNKERALSGKSPSWKKQSGRFAEKTLLEVLAELACLLKEVTEDWGGYGFNAFEQICRGI